MTVLSEQRRTILFATGVLIAAAEQVKNTNPKEANTILEVALGLLRAHMVREKPDRVN